VVPPPRRRTRRAPSAGGREGWRLPRGKPSYSPSSRMDPDAPRPEPLRSSAPPM
jgi:hypothetical protein